MFSSSHRENVLVSSHVPTMQSFIQDFKIGWGKAVTHWAEPWRHAPRNSSDFKIYGLRYGYQDFIYFWLLLLLLFFFVGGGGENFCKSLVGMHHLSLLTARQRWSTIWFMYSPKYHRPRQLRANMYLILINPIPIK